MSTALRTLFRLAVILGVTLLVIGGTVVAVEHGAGSLIVGSVGRGEERFEGRAPGGENGQAPTGQVGETRRGPGAERQRPDRGTRPEGGGEGLERGEGFGRGGFGWNELWDAARQMAVIGAVVIALSIIWRPISRRLRKRRQRRAAPPPAAA